MARESLIAATPCDGFEWLESDPYERVIARLQGIDALASVFIVGEELGAKLAPTVWATLWGFIGQITDDIHHDMHQLHRQRSELQHALR